MARRCAGSGCADGIVVVVQGDRAELNDGVISTIDLEIDQEVEVRFADWRGVFRRHVAQSRQILKKALVGGITFGSGADGVYECSGQASLGGIVAGLACTKTVGGYGVEPVVEARSRFRRQVH